LEEKDNAPNKRPREKGKKLRKEKWTGKIEGETSTCRGGKGKGVLDGPEPFP